MFPPFLSEWCYGLVIFTGQDTKLMQNSGKTIFKRTSIDKLLNLLIIRIVLFLLALCLFCSVTCFFWEYHTGEDFQVPYCDRLISARSVIFFFFFVLCKFLHTIFFGLFFLRCIISLFLFILSPDISAMGQYYTEWRQVDRMCCDSVPYILLLCDCHEHPRAYISLCEVRYRMCCIHILLLWYICDILFMIECCRYIFDVT